MNTVTITETSKALRIPEESVRILVKFHRIATDNVNGQLIARDEDVHYFDQYISTYGRLPNLPKLEIDKILDN